MNHYFYQLTPPRPTFLQDMTAEEGALMQAHAAYWQERLAEGLAVLFGPVADPAGAFGLGILKAEDGEHAARLIAEDPAIKSGRGFASACHVMPQVVHR